MWIIFGIKLLFEKLVFNIFYKFISVLYRKSPDRGKNSSVTLKTNQAEAMVFTGWQQRPPSLVLWARTIFIALFALCFGLGGYFVPDQGGKICLYFFGFLIFLFTLRSFLEERISWIICGKNFVITCDYRGRKTIIYYSKIIKYRMINYPQENYNWLTIRDDSGTIIRIRTGWYDVGNLYDYLTVGAIKGHFIDGKTTNLSIVINQPSLRGSMTEILQYNRETRPQKRVRLLSHLTKLSYCCRRPKSLAELNYLIDYFS